MVIDRNEKRLHYMYFVALSTAVAYFPAELYIPMRIVVVI